MISFLFNPEKRLIRKAAHLLEKGRDLNSVFRNELPFLQYAVVNNFTSAVNYLLDNGADPDMPSGEHGFAALHCAVMKARKDFSEDIVKALLACGASLRAGSVKGETPLHLAAYFSNTGQMRVLTMNTDERELREIMNIRDSEAEIPLHKAAWWGNTEAVKFLVQHGSDINCRNSDGMSPLHMTVFFLRADAMKALIEAGAEPCVINAGGHTARDMLETYILPDEPGKKEMMIEMLKSAGDIRVEDDPLIDIASQKAREDDIPGALDVYDELAEKYPDSIIPFYYRAHCKICLDMNEEALRDFKKALDLDDSIAEIHCSAGKILIEMHRIEEGMESMRKAAELGDEDAAAFIEKVEGLEGALNGL